MQSPVVISGMGALCAAGRTASEILSTFSSGRRSPARPAVFTSPLPYPVFEIKDFTHSPKVMRTLALAEAAWREAAAAADLGDDLTGLRVGVCLGTSVASQLNDEVWYRQVRGTGRMDPDPIEVYFHGNLAEALADRLRAEGPALTLVNACSSGTDALGAALDWLATGQCDLVIAGGADEISNVPYCGFGALGVTSSAACRPFDKDRDGLNLGEGAGILVLETEASARRRSRPTDLRLLGYGAAADAFHLTAPRPDGSGLETAIRIALTHSGLGPRDISFVNAHGTSTRDNDRAEGKTLLRCFGGGLKFLSTKGYTGHTLGAAGALEAIFTAQALRQGWVPASAGFETLDEEIGIAPVSTRTEIRGRAALSTSLAFGGNNSAVVLSLA